MMSKKIHPFLKNKNPPVLEDREGLLLSSLWTVMEDCQFNGFENVVIMIVGSKLKVDEALTPQTLILIIILIGWFKFINCDHNLSVIEIKQFFANDIESNPGPYTDRAFKIVSDFVSGKNISEKMIKETVRKLATYKLTSNDFLDDSRINIWTDLRDKINNSFGTDFNDKIDTIWDAWENELSKRELAERELTEKREAETAHCETCHCMNSLCPPSLTPTCTTTKTSPTAVLKTAETSPTTVLTTAEKSPTTVPTTKEQSPTTEQPKTTFCLDLVTPQQPHNSHSTDAGVQKVILSHPVLPSPPLPQPNNVGNQEAIFKPEAVPIYNPGGQPTGTFYNYGRSIDGKTFICQSDCKAIKGKSNVKGKGVTRETLVSHCNRNHGLKLNLLKRIAVIRATKDIICSVCNREFEHEKTLKKHLSDFHPNHDKGSMKPINGNNSNDVNISNVDDIINVVLNNVDISNDADLSNVDITKFIVNNDDYDDYFLPLGDTIMN